MRRFILIVSVLFTNVASADELKVGIIGLDTSHAIAFTKILNDPNAKADVAGCRVVAAYPNGSPDIQSSVSRVPKYTEQIKGMGVEIVPSIEALLEKVDVVLLETNDGRPHLEQLIPVLRAGKRTFIDKPVAGSLADAIAIYDAADHFKVPVWSSSSLRYGKATQELARSKSVKSCWTHSPASIEKTHPDLFWYGIHGVESLFTIMGDDCVSVARSEDDGKIIVTGTWKDGRKGTFREKKGYGGMATTADGEVPVGKYDGYRPLLVEVVKYFKGGALPVTPEETLAIYAFMEAADESKHRDGAEVKLSDVMAKTKSKAKDRLQELGVN
jgi:predicted dehydrogenase